MARLFMMKSLLLDNKPLVITTDNDGDIAVLRTLATTILGRNVKVLEDTHTLWGLEEKKDDIFVVPVSLWCQSGGLQWLRKESRYDINIGEEISPEKYIEKLIEFGYMHQNYIGELGSYKRE
jgi:transcription-repair coupling factor (superfamily II helicase)